MVGTGTAGRAGALLLLALLLHRPAAADQADPSKDQGDPPEDQAALTCPVGGTKGPDSPAHKLCPTGCCGWIFKKRGFFCDVETTSCTDIAYNGTFAYCKAEPGKVCCAGIRSGHGTGFVKAKKLEDCAPRWCPQGAKDADDAQLAPKPCVDSNDAMRAYTKVERKCCLSGGIYSCELPFSFRSVCANVTGEEVCANAQTGGFRACGTPKTKCTDALTSMKKLCGTKFGKMNRHTCAHYDGCESDDHVKNAEDFSLDDDVALGACLRSYHVCGMSKYKVTDCGKRGRSAASSAFKCIKSEEDCDFSLIKNEKCQISSLVKAAGNAWDCEAAWRTCVAKAIFCPSGAGGAQTECPGGRCCLLDAHGSVRCEEDEAKCAAADEANRCLPGFDRCEVEGGKIKRLLAEPPPKYVCAEQNMNMMEDCENSKGPLKMSGKCSSFKDCNTDEKVIRAEGNRLKCLQAYIDCALCDKNDRTMAAACEEDDELKKAGKCAKYAECLEDDRVLKAGFSKEDCLAAYDSCASDKVREVDQADATEDPNQKEDRDQTEDANQKEDHELRSGALGGLPAFPFPTLLPLLYLL